MPHMPRAPKRYYEKSRPNGKKEETEESPIPANFYKLQKWVKFRSAGLRENPFCVECMKLGLYVLGTVLDHINPISQGGAIWDRANTQTLCESHHNRKRRRERRKSNT